jgi:hypothetical protein
MNKPALALTALAVAVLAGCGGGGSTSSHASRPALSCQQQADHIQNLLTQAIKDGWLASS